MKEDNGDDDEEEDWGDEDDWDNVSPCVKSPEPVKEQKENIFATDKSQLPYQFIKAFEVLQN